MLNSAKLEIYSTQKCQNANNSCWYFNIYEQDEFQATVMILSFRTVMSGQTVPTQIRLLLEEQSDQGLHCLLFHLHLFNEIP